MTAVRGRDEPRWHASLAVVAAIALYVTLPPKLTFGPLWLFPLLVLGFLIPLSVLAPLRRVETRAQRWASLALIAIVNIFNLASVILLVASLITPSAHHAAQTGKELLLAGVEIWITNIIVFSLWYWEVDAGGPQTRARSNSAADFDAPDFLFPQMNPGAGGEAMCVRTGWRPRFLDYVYLAFNTSTALSPADTMPLTEAAKAFMMVQSTISFVTIAVIVSRAINILG